MCLFPLCARLYVACLSSSYDIKRRVGAFSWIDRGGSFVASSPVFSLPMTMTMTMSMTISMTMIMTASLCRLLCAIDRGGLLWRFLVSPTCPWRCGDVMTASLCRLLRRLPWVHLPFPCYFPLHVYFIPAEIIRVGHLLLSSQLVFCLNQFPFLFSCCQQASSYCGIFSLCGHFGACGSLRIPACDLVTLFPCGGISKITRLLLRIP